uniref:Uncharacterized protein n=1 Tax=Candidatus Kentrum eta TaxID=2126337 RepID=A0A450UJZ9_9GAMM|nr:MAG: hypothetical protein BECKH772A_GA0070896_1000839 [Candidatus Kentron sp. H]VFJ92824.1 MAG: hypothetical protein BECKH772B_GA0070898_1003412 [Candidatus Kentron sp. H]VFJ94782.1 MAG: hypothetical protein BECKH772C_GA0070978_1000111 [Candidatus Kentron sp. H]
MAHFPKAETGVFDLRANPRPRMVTGLTTHMDLFPAPPVTMEALAALAASPIPRRRTPPRNAMPRPNTPPPPKDEALRVLTDDMKMPPCATFLHYLSAGSLEACN